MFRSGWVTSPQYAAYLGNPGRVRIFWDGVETIALGASTSYPLDLATVPIWAVQQMTLERGADEVRIYLQSWTVQRTVTQSRVDIVTGDLGTNMLRGYLRHTLPERDGRAVRRAGVRDDERHHDRRRAPAPISWRASAGRAGASASTRTSSARTARVTRRSRRPTIPIFVHPELAGGIPGQNGSRTNAYLRVGLGQADSSRWWAQAMLDQQEVSQQLRCDGSGHRPHSLPVGHAAREAERDAGDRRGGTQRGAVQRERIRSATAGSRRERARRSPGGRRSRRASRPSPATWTTSRTAAGSPISALKVTPLSWLALEGGVGYRIATAAQGGDGVSGRLAVGRAARARAGSPSARCSAAPTWCPDSRSTTRLYKSASAAAATGSFLSIKGKLVEDVGINVWSVRWEKPGYYRPQTAGARRGVPRYRVDDASSRAGTSASSRAFGARMRSDVDLPDDVGGGGGRIRRRSSPSRASTSSRTSRSACSTRRSTSRRTGRSIRGRTNWCRSTCSRCRSSRTACGGASGIDYRVAGV